MKDLVEAIHATPARLVLVVTGGGSEVIGELLRHGGGSQTLLEAIVPYHPQAFERLVGGTPDQHGSAAAARDLAMAAFERAKSLVGAQELSLLGVGATCALVKADEREGRAHQVHVALQTADRTATTNLFLTPGRSREEEEAIAAALILRVVAEGCGLADLRPVAGLEPHETPIATAMVADEMWIRVVNGLADSTAIPLGGGVTDRPTILFPGSFNPVHRAHLQMARIAHELLGGPVDLEVSVRNVDKPALNYVAIHDRIERLRAATAGHAAVGRLYLTNAPTFLQKARLFPGVTFLVGYDTFERIGTARYYHTPEHRESVLTELADLGTRFLVFYRQGAPEGSWGELREIHPTLAALARTISLDLFRDDDGLASRRLRRQA